MSLRETAAKRAAGYAPSSPSLTAPPFTPDAASRSDSKPPSVHSRHTGSSSPIYRVKLSSASGKATASEAVVARHRMGRARLQPTPPHTPPATPRETSLVCVTLAKDQEDRDSPTDNLSNAATESTLSSQPVSCTKILLKASEMIYSEVKLCENRLAALWQQEREARDLSCSQLRRDVEAMVGIVEALSSQVHKAPVDSRLDAFLEQEKRARDSLREDVESLADQINTLEEDRVKDAKDANGMSVMSMEQVNCLLEEERKARDFACAALRKDLDALSTSAEQERHARDLSNAVLRKDFKKELEAVALDLRQNSSQISSPSDEEPCQSRLNEVLEKLPRINEVLETQRSSFEAMCADLRKEMEAISLVAGSLTAADLSNKCTGGTGAVDVSMADSQHLFMTRLNKQKEDISQVETMTEHFRLDLANSSDAVYSRLEKIDTSINELQFEMRAAQALQRCLVEAVNLAPAQPASNACS